MYWQSYANASGDAGYTTAVSRRGFIRLAAGGALAGSALALLSACSGVVPRAPTSGATPGAAPAATSGGAASAYPNYFPVTSGPTPDFPAAGPEYQVGFVNFPKNPPKSWNKAPPGSGGKVVSYTNTGAPVPPTPMDQNPAWQEVNKQLNATVDFQIILQSDYPAKLATMMAGNDLTDFVLIGKNVQNLTAFL